MRVLIHAQHLSGVGHYVRAYEIARELAGAHEVHLVDGGREVPRAQACEGLRRVVLPPIARGPRGLQAIDASRPIGAVLAERRDLLSAAAAKIAPDAFLVEHYPFSKWELEEEILGAVEAARALNPGMRLVCLLRDISPRTRHEDAAAHEERVVSELNTEFDAVFVHADPGFTSLKEHFAAAGRLGIPLAHTGFVSEKLRQPAPVFSEGHAVLSVGGGAGAFEFVRTCVEAWKRLRTGMRLVVFAGLSFGESELGKIREATAGGPFLLQPFGSEFLAWLAQAELSISRAGYNTCANLLETRRRALLVADAHMSDQRFRARRFAELGLASSVEPDGLDVDQMVEAMRLALRREPPVHEFDLAGAARTRTLLEAL